MRLAILVSATFLIVSCKSKDKAQDHSAAPAAKAEAKVDAAKSAVKEAAKDAKKAMTESASKVECKLKSETRTLEVRGKDKGCEAAYTKGGQENVVGSSQNGTAHCEAIVGKIKDKLAAAGYTCN